MGGSLGPLVARQKASDNRQRVGGRDPGRGGLDVRASFCRRLSITCTWGGTARAHQEPLAAALLFFFFFFPCLRVGLWSIKGGWRSAPCFASLQSNCLFFQGEFQKKDDIYQSLLSDDLGGREKGQVVLSVAAGKGNKGNLQGRKCLQISMIGIIMGRWLQFGEQFQSVLCLFLSPFASSLAILASPAPTVH